MVPDLGRVPMGPAIVLELQLPPGMVKRLLPAETPVLLRGMEARPRLEVTHLLLLAVGAPQRQVGIPRQRPVEVALQPLEETHPQQLVAVVLRPPAGTHLLLPVAVALQPLEEVHQLQLAAAGPQPPVEALPQQQAAAVLPHLKGVPQQPLAVAALPLRRANGCR